MIQISAVVITFNEEKNIRRCITSVKPVADEIIVVDSFSKDGTRRICEEEGVKFVEHAFEGHIQQKNFAVTIASNDFVLSLDADEFLSEELANSIKIVKTSGTLQAYSMNRLNGIAGRWIRSTDWYPDKKLRLWNKNIGKWGGYNPHDTVVVSPGTKVQHLSGNLMHDSYQNYHEMMVKAVQYAKIFAHANQHKKSSSILKVIYKSVFTFIRNYFIKYGFLNGVDGLVISYTNAYYTFHKYLMLLKLNRSGDNGAIAKNV
jgi:glycosyltransferase involved in cell wall biosynthesis